MKPILFSTPMVQAILDGRKTQTRRICTSALESDCDIHKSESIGECYHNDTGWSEYENGACRCRNTTKPKYKIGDILYVRETWLDDGSEYGNIHYKASATAADLEWLKSNGLKWKPSLFMPKAYARIFLKITNIRVERLQDISEEDAIAEGVDYCDEEKPWTCFDGTPISSYKFLWNSINKKSPEKQWEANPYVFVYEFERVAKPEVLR